MPPRHSYTTRLLHSILPASCYASDDKSIDGLHAAIAAELTSLFYDGLEILAAWLYIAINLASGLIYIRMQYIIELALKEFPGHRPRLMRSRRGSTWASWGPRATGLSFEKPMGCGPALSAFGSVIYVLAMTLSLPQQYILETN